MTQFIGNIPLSKPNHRRHEGGAVFSTEKASSRTERTKTPVVAGDMLFAAKQLHSVQCTTPGGFDIVGVIYPGTIPRSTTKSRGTHGKPMATHSQTLSTLVEAFFAAAFASSTDRAAGSRRKRPPARTICAIKALRAGGISRYTRAVRHGGTTSAAASIPAHDTDSWVTGKDYPDNTTLISRWSGSSAPPASSTLSAGAQQRRLCSRRVSSNNDKHGRIQPRVGAHSHRLVERPGDSF